MKARTSTSSARRRVRPARRSHEARGVAGPLAQTLARLHDVAALNRLVSRVARQADAISAELRDAVLAQIPAFSESRNPEVLPQLAHHVPQHATEIIRLLSGGELGDFTFVREHARVRASQFFPLEAILHAYRCGHKVYTRRLLAEAGELPAPAIAALADFTGEYADVISTIASVEYVEQARRLAAVAADEQTALLDLLLSGYDEADRRVAVRLREAGYLDGRQAFCVVLAQSVDPAHMRDAARARRLADTLEALVPSSLARRLVGVRSGTVTMVLAAVRRVSGWTAPLPSLSARVVRELALAGNDVLIGVSPDVEATAQIPAAHRKATLALRLAHVGERVRPFDGITLRELMIHQATAGLREFLPAWHESFAQADRRGGGALADTLRAHAATSLNVLQTAARLRAHPNTVYARFERIRALTGLDARTYGGLETLLLVLDAAQAILPPAPRGATELSPAPRTAAASGTR